jgi:hypothetical protein
MRFGFEQVWGPFLGLHSPIARILTGLHEMLDGICLLICVLFDALGFFGEELSSIAKALSIVTGISCMLHSAVGAMINYFLDGAPGMHGHLALASGFFVTLRLCVAGPETFGAQMLCAWLSFVPVAVAMFILLANKLYGKHQSLVHGQKRRLHELREEVISNAYRFRSDIMDVQGPIAKLVNRTPLKGLGLFSSSVDQSRRRSVAVVSSSQPQEMHVQGNPVRDARVATTEKQTQDDRVEAARRELEGKIRAQEKKNRARDMEKRFGGPKTTLQMNRQIIRPPDRQPQSRRLDASRTPSLSPRTPSLSQRSTDPMVR